MKRLVGKAWVLYIAIYVAVAIPVRLLVGQWFAEGGVWPQAVAGAVLLPVSYFAFSAVVGRLIARVDATRTEAERGHG